LSIEDYRRVPYNKKCCGIQIAVDKVLDFFGNAQNGLCIARKVNHFKGLKPIAVDTKKAG
jgi:hypothetical protein